MADKPKITAPGLIWRPTKTGWEARWQPRTDLVKRGCPMKSTRLWAGAEPDDTERAYIADRCRHLQDEMLIWGRGGIPTVGTVFDGTIQSLVNAYQTDIDSTYRKLRYRSRQNGDRLCSRICHDHGDELVANVKARQLKAWHDQWQEGGHVAMAHGLIGQARTLFGFGATFLEDPECERLCGVMHNMRFKQAKAREERMTAEQAIAVIAAAHELGRGSIALAQAFQFELMLRQKDVIGEWLPLSEPGVSDVIWSNQKWCAGLRWDEIDANLILRHTTSKRQKPIEVNLRLAPMVMAELDQLGELPTRGPIVVCEQTGKPWTEHEFRKKWRKVATAAGLPRAVKNMDTRAGAITEALLAGAPMDSVRKSATHSDAAMTQRYSRDDAAASANVAEFRIAHRNKK